MPGVTQHVLGVTQHVLEEALETKGVGCVLPKP